jgi:ketosteroid isomerase-like protein
LRDRPGRGEGEREPDHDDLLRAAAARLLAPRRWERASMRPPHRAKRNRFAAKTWRDGPRQHSAKDELWGAVVAYRYARAMGAERVLYRYQAAMNAHDLEALLDCFDPGYESVQPLNPDRDFRGRETVRERWTTIFREVPDFRAELLRSAVDGEEAWGEWRWRGTRADGSAIDVRGVTIVGAPDERIVWGRFYLEEAGAGGGGMRIETAG